MELKVKGQIEKQVRQAITGTWKKSYEETGTVSKKGHEVEKR